MTKHFGEDLINRRMKIDAANRLFALDFVFGFGFNCAAAKRQTDEKLQRNLNLKVGRKVFIRIIISVLFAG
jgi:hypothetical protein